MTTQTPVVPFVSVKVKWSTEDSARLYQVPLWSQGYFAVSTDGRVRVRPNRSRDTEIDLLEVVEGLAERDLSPPLLIRFSDILADRLRALHDAFQTAIDEHAYDGRYLAVFPIKVNQQRLVVEEVYRYGRDYQFGLEVGSKPELLAAMAITDEASERLIICNGFKDDAYVEAVILSTKLGRNIIPVIEKFSELRLVLKHAQAYGVRPTLGVRIKLASRGTGRWSDSAGERSKFGLSASEILDMVELLSVHDMLDRLSLLHCHLGSQIQDIRRLKEAIGELGHVYAELVKLGVPLQYVDIGGGLAVDYDGSRTNTESSMNYTMEEYAAEVVYRLGSVCDERNVAKPTIVSESGRAMAAYQSVLVINVVGASGPRTTHEPPFDMDATKDAPQPIRDLANAFRDVSADKVVDAYHDAVQGWDEALDLFKLGYLSLEQRGMAERLFWATCARAYDLAQELDRMPEELLPLEEILSETYFCNFSVFQSLPDSWAIGQLFPIMPIHRLDERPTHRAVLADITCDSDGKIDRFPNIDEVRRVLEVHKLRKGEDYFLAAFLVGAYQETLGDLHNLFGDTHVAHVRLHEEGGWWIEETVKGDSARDVLGYMRYDVDRIIPRLVQGCETAVREGRMTLNESRVLVRFYESALNGYTYLEAEA